MSGNLLGLVEAERYLPLHSLSHRGRLASLRVRLLVLILVAVIVVLFHRPAVAA